MRIAEAILSLATRRRRGPEARPFAIVADSRNSEPKMQPFHSFEGEGDRPFCPALGL